jgi:hypothetical protein
VYSVSIVVETLVSFVILNVFAISP